MPAFHYSAVDGQGRTQRGTIESESARRARERLRAEGLTPLDIRILGDGGGERGRRSPAPLSLAQLAVLTRQLASLTASGISPEHALRAVSRHARGGARARLLLDVLSHIQQGYAVGESFRRSGAFPGEYAAAVGAGERAGRLAAAFAELADHLEARADARSKLQGALVYPSLLVLVALAIVVALLAFVLPQVLAIFTESERALPFLTRAMLGLSRAAADWGGLLAAVLVLGGLAIKAALLEPRAALLLHRLVLRIPVVSGVVRAAGTARFAATLALLVASRVPVLEALHAAAGVLPNRALRADVERAAREVEQGSTLQAAVARGRFLSPVTEEFIASGETAGRLAEMLRHAAAHEQSELESRLELLLRLLEPALIIVIGAFVLAVVLAVMLPVFALNELAASAS